MLSIKESNLSEFKDTAPEYSYTIFWRDPFTGVILDPRCADLASASIVIGSISKSPMADKLVLSIPVRDGSVRGLLSGAESLSPEDIEVVMYPSTVPPWVILSVDRSSDLFWAITVQLISTLDLGQTATLTLSGRRINPLVGEALILIQEYQGQAVTGNKTLSVSKYPRVVYVQNMYFTLYGSYPPEIVTQVGPTQRFSVNWRTNRIDTDPGGSQLSWNAPLGQADVSKTGTDQGIVTYSGSDDKGLCTQTDLSFTLINMRNRTILGNMIQATIQSLYPVVRILTTNLGQQPPPNNTVTLVWSSLASYCYFSNVPGIAGTFKVRPTSDLQQSPITYITPSDSATAPISLVPVYADDAEHLGDPALLIHKINVPQVLYSTVWYGGAFQYLGMILGNINSVRWSFQGARQSESYDGSFESGTYVANFPIIGEDTLYNVNTYDSEGNISSTYSVYS